MKRFSVTWQSIGALVASSLGYLLGCATPARVRVVEGCLSDPRKDALQCTDVDGKSFTKPFQEAYDYACFPLDQITEYMDGCR